MLELAFLIGSYSYSVFLLGILGFLYKPVVAYLGLVYLIIGSFYLLKKRSIPNRLSNFSKFLILLIIAEIFINFIGVLGPELSFDALWYHLTIPKIFLENHKIFHINGGIFYYSDMPKNIDMLYVFALSLGNEITAKFIHFLLGIACLIAIYNLSRKFFDKNLSLLSVLVFYSSLVVGWQSISAYVDLGTALFSVLSITEFLNWADKKDTRHLLTSAFLVGLSISTKVVSLISLPVFILLIVWVNANYKNNFRATVKNITYFVFISVLISLPWFLFSYINTGNPFYPILSKGFSFSYDTTPVSLLKNVIFPSDPVNPIYIVTFPLILFYYKRLSRNLKYLFVYLLFFLLIWIFIAPVGGSRLVLPYLPVFSVLSVVCITYAKNQLFKKYLIFLIIIIAVSSIFYRLLANMKYIPVIFGFETKQSFLSNNLNFSFGDFYDTDNFFKNNIKQTDRVLTYGFHNLYYADFTFIDSSFVKKGDKFNYIATQNTILSEKFSNFKQIHYNTKTGVRIYSAEGKMWEY